MFQSLLNNHFSVLIYSSFVIFSSCSSFICLKKTTESYQRIIPQARREQKRKSMLICISMPVDPVSNMVPKKGEKRMLESCQGLNFSLNSRGTEINRGNTAETLTPKPIDPKIALNQQNPIKCRTKQKVLQQTIMIKSILSLTLHLIEEDPATTNLRVVLAIQKIVPHIAASSLFITPVMTAQEGSHPEAVPSTPIMKTKARENSISSFIDAQVNSFLSFCYAFSIKDSSFFIGEGQQKSKSILVKKVTAMKQYALTPPPNLMRSGEKSAPNPKFPLVRGIHEPAFSLAIQIKHSLPVTRMAKWAPPKIAKLKNYPNLVSHHIRMKLATKANRPHEAMILCQTSLCYLKRMYLQAMKAMTLPTVRAIKMMQYQGQGTFLSLERQGMIGPMLPVTMPLQKNIKQYMARYIRGSTLLFDSIIYYSISVIIQISKRANRVKQIYQIIIIQNHENLSNSEDIVIPDFDSFSINFEQKKQTIPRERLITRKEQKRKSRFIFINSPVRPVRNIEARKGGNIRFASCSGRNFNLYSIGTAIKRGNTAEIPSAKPIDPITTAPNLTLNSLSKKQRRLKNIVRVKRALSFRLALI